jgi:hypothetical protein
MEGRQLPGIAVESNRRPAVVSDQSCERRDVPSLGRRLDRARDLLSHACLSAV